MKIDIEFWKNKRVFITGHTGFKGSWLSLWLTNIGCEVSGYALKPNTTPNLFDVLDLEKKMDHNIADIRNYDVLFKKIDDFKPDIIFHLAAQPLVRYSYDNPRETYETNVMGTVNLLDAVRNYGKAQATIIVTSDKCYENQEQIWGYRESDPMGGHDPYSNSKGCSELVTASYANSYFMPDQNKIGKVASARAGNVIGGGDWSDDRLIPDIIKSIYNKESLNIRNPQAIRPWQHVLEPLCGYMITAQHLYKIEEQTEVLNWNFGPNQEDQKDVGFVANSIKEECESSINIQTNKSVNNQHEANLLFLDCSKAKKDLSWSPKWNIKQTIKNTANWYKAYYDNQDMLKTTLTQINDYQNQ